MDAIGASYFLPDNPEDAGKDELKKNDLSTRIKNIFGNVAKPSGTKTKAFELTSIDVTGSGTSGGGESKGKGNGGKGKHKGDGSGDGQRGGSDDGEDKGLKQIPVKKRLMCEDASSGLYVLTMMVPSTANTGKLRFSLSGEQSEFELPISNAKVLSEGSRTTIAKVKGNTIYLNNLTKSERLRIEVEVDFDKHCMMEVDYYANKR